tara:strand:- start:1039 stop:1200 length:162 start_codon:yes stop_codon:yes gene_type:complete
MSTSSLKPGTIVAHPESGDKGQLLGPFIRNGERWWTIHWQEAGTVALSEAQIQ